MTKREYHPCFILELIRQMACKVIVTDIYTRNKWEEKKNRPIKFALWQANRSIFFTECVHREIIIGDTRGGGGEREKKKGKKGYVNEGTKQQNGLLNLHKIGHNYISSFQQTVNYLVKTWLGQILTNDTTRETRFPSIGYSRWQRIIDLISQWKSQLCSQEFRTGI